MYEIVKGRIFDRFYFLEPQQQAQKDGDYDDEPFLGRHIVELTSDDVKSLTSGLTDSWDHGLHALNYFTYDGHFVGTFARYALENILNEEYANKHEKARQEYNSTNGKDGTQFTSNFYDFGDKKKDEVVRDEKDEKENELKSEQKVVFVSGSGQSSEEISLDKLMHCKYFSTNSEVTDNKVWEVKLRAPGDIDNWLKFLLSNGVSKVKKREDFGKIYQLCDFVDSSKWRRLVAKFIGLELLAAPLEKLDKFFIGDDDEQKPESDA